MLFVGLVIKFVISFLTLPLSTLGSAIAMRGGAQRQSCLSTSSWHRVHTVNQYERRHITSRKNGRNAWKIKKKENWCALDGSWIYQQMQGKHFLSTSEEEFAAEKVGANAEIGMSTSRRLCERPLFRCRLQDKRRM